MRAIPIRWPSNVAIGKSVLEEPPPTGLPKGAMLTHANLSAAISQYQPISRDHPRRSAGPGVENIEEPLRAYEVEAQDVAFDNLQLAPCI